MLSAGLTNARRTGDLCNMTLQEFASHWPSRANPNDHIVHVRRHKTALGGKPCKVNFYDPLFAHTQRYVDVKTALGGKPCKVNFYDPLFAHTQRYVDVFGGQFLQTAPPTGLLFPHLSHGGQPCCYRRWSGSKSGYAICHTWDRLGPLSVNMIVWSPFASRQKHFA